MTSRRKQRRRSCEGKRRHADKQAAMFHLVLLRQSGSPGRLNVYLCRFCKGWHVGHLARTRATK